MGPGGLRGARKPSWGLWGSDTRCGQQQTPREGKKQQVGPRRTPCLHSGVCWRSHNMALTLSPQVFHLRHIQIHLPQHPPCVPRHCLSYGEAQCHGPGWAFAPSPKHCSSCTVLVPHPCSACALATASAKLSLKPNKHPKNKAKHSFLQRVSPSLSVPLLKKRLLGSAFPLPKC